MKMTIAKIFPEDDELLCDLYYRMKDNIEYYLDQHHDTSIDVIQNIEENCVLIKSLKLGDSVN